MNVFIQKGFKVFGIAKNLKPGDSGFDAARSLLIEAIGDAFPIHFRLS